MFTRQIQQIVFHRPNYGVIQFAASFVCFGVARFFMLNIFLDGISCYLYVQLVFARFHTIGEANHSTLLKQAPSSFFIEELSNFRHRSRQTQSTAEIGNFSS
jgi:hypothetical protein